MTSNTPVNETAVYIQGLHKIDFDTRYYIWNVIVDFSLLLHCKISNIVAKFANMLQSSLILEFASQFVNKDRDWPQNLTKPIKCSGYKLVGLQI